MNVAVDANISLYPNAPKDGLPAKAFWCFSFNVQRLSAVLTSDPFFGAKGGNTDLDSNAALKSGAE